MHLSSLMNSNFIVILDSISSKEEAINRILEKIKKNYNSKFDEKSVLAKIRERESLSSTSFSNFIAIPHARIEDFNDFIVGVAVLKKEIIHDEKPIKMIVLILTGKSESSLYLNTLSTFVKISMNKELFNSLVKINDENEFIEIITQNKFKVKKEISVEDIMTKDAVSISPEHTLKELLDVMSKNKINYIPVKDDLDNYLGELNTGDIIRLGIPSYATMIGNLSFLSNFEPFEELLKNEDTIKVKNIYRQSVVKITPESSLIELAFKLSQNNKRHASVVKDGKLVGVVSIHDIINKVLRG